MLLLQLNKIQCFAAQLNKIQCFGRDSKFSLCGRTKRNAFVRSSDFLGVRLNKMQSQQCFNLFAIPQVFAARLNKLQYQRHETRQKQEAVTLGSVEIFR
jgi:hypothetical protein